MRICKRHKLFVTHSEPELAALLSKAQLIELSPGEQLFRLGAEATSLFVVTSGELVCSGRDDVEVKILGKGARPAIASRPMPFCRRIDAAMEGLEARRG